MVNRADWTFGGTWPYAPRWFDSADGRIHYVDEGPQNGRPVVMVHGNPTWGYLYRNFVGPVVDNGHRAIVIDHLGFGRSEKPDDPELYLLERSCKRLEALLESLDLSDATPVVQDWGGPHGMYWASRHPQRVRSLCILNTYAHRLRENLKLPIPVRLLRARGLGELLVKRLDLFKRFTLFGGPTGINPERLTDAVKMAYRAPHPHSDSRTAILRFFRNVPTEVDEPNSELLGEIENRLVADLRDKPVKICWGMNDPVFTEDEFLKRLWLDTFPGAEVVRIPHASHFVQEDAHEVVVPELLSLLNRD
jgi:pimeloyl-ACP methyl ester carboxylesterase